MKHVCGWLLLEEAVTGERKTSQKRGFYSVDSSKGHIKNVLDYYFVLEWIDGFGLIHDFFHYIIFFAKTLAGSGVAKCYFLYL